ncbi:MAG TPA: PhoH family protein [Elusimicrobiota bacterium]|nr:PhoH family protein [Elusimicrobiota bacterium]
MGTKHFVLDTNVVLYDPNSIYNFQDNIVIIPIWIIEEIDAFKKDLNDTGRNAREFSRHLDILRKKGDLTQGVPLDNGGRLQVWINFSQTVDLPFYLKKESYDNLILATAFQLQKKGEQVVLITRDVNLRIKADAFGLSAMDYETQRVEADKLYDGWKDLKVTGQLINDLYQNKRFDRANISSAILNENEFVCLTNEANPSQSALAIHRNSEIHLLPPLPPNIWGIRPRNIEQQLALHLLLNDQIPLVTITGKAGTGKTLLALAAGMFKTMDENHYQKCLVSRPIFPIGKDIGFLPGEVKDKLRPWMQPIFDNLEFLMHTTKNDRKGPRYNALIEQGLLEIEALTYIRGRSIASQYFLVDEAQNLTPHEAKTIITRVGENTKIVLTGDIYQIDNYYNDSSHNGLSYVVECLKSEPLAGHMTLSKGERSPLAELAANRL